MKTMRASSHERIYLDKADRNLLHDDITVVDHALTRPWTVTKTYRRNLDPHGRLAGVYLQRANPVRADRGSSSTGSARTAP